MKIKFGVFFVISILLYLVTVKGVLGNFSDAQSINNQKIITSEIIFDAPHTISSYVLMLSMLQDGSIPIKESYAKLAVPDVGYFKGNFYSFFPPGIAVLIMPLYILGSTIGFGLLFSNITIVLFALLSLILLYKICRDIILFSIPESLFVLFIYAFCSTAWPYAIAIFQHQITTFFFLALIYCIFRESKEEKSEKKISLQIAITSIYGLSVFFDYPNALLLLPLLFYFLVQKIRRNQCKRMFIIVNGSLMLLFVSTSLFYNHNVYGSYMQISNALPIYDGTNLDILKVNNERINRQKPAYKAFDLTSIPSGLNSLFFHPKNSLFVFTPLFLFALLGIPTFVRVKRPFFLLILFQIFWVIFVYSTFVGGAHGGWSFGPRYLIPCIPFIAILTVWALVHLKQKKITTLVFFLLLAYSMANALSSALTTRSIPKSEEGMAYGIKNFDLILANKSGGFFYNVVLRNTMSLLTFFSILYVLLLALAIALYKQVKSSTEKTAQII
jgi:hypothetical protein